MKNTDDDGFPDINIDLDGDGDPDLNIDTDGDGECDVNCDTNSDGKPDINIDVDGDKDPDINIDTDGDGEPDENLKDQDTDGDGECDLNCDTDGDGIPDKNVDVDGDGDPDINIDDDGDGECDRNCISEYYGNPNLSNLRVENYVISPGFNSYTTEYSVTVASDATSVNVIATPLNPNATVTGAGRINLTSDSTRIAITVTAEDGSTKTYYLTITKEEEPPIVDPGDGEFDFNELEGLLTVQYTTPLNVSNIRPGWTGSHEFVLTNHSDRTIVYNINLINVENTFTSDNFVYSLVKDGRTIVDPTTAVKEDATIAGELIIGPGESKRFSINYEFVEIGAPQDYDQGRHYSGTVEIMAIHGY